MSPRFARLSNFELSQTPQGPSTSLVLRDKRSCPPASPKASFSGFGEANSLQSLGLCGAGLELLTCVQGCRAGGVFKGYCKGYFSGKKTHTRDVLTDTHATASMLSS